LFAAHAITNHLLALVWWNHLFRCREICASFLVRKQVGLRWKFNMLLETTTVAEVIAKARLLSWHFELLMWISTMMSWQR
jgi:hypothetical protein